MTKQGIFITKTAEETQELGRSFANELKPGDIVAMYGELGSGKTTFIQGLAKGFGIARRIISPTFIISRSYKLSLKRRPLSSVNNFYHIDLYRVESERDLESVGIKEILSDRNAIVAIEWAEKLGSALPKKAMTIHFRYVNDKKREITMYIKNQK